MGNIVYSSTDDGSIAKESSIPLGIKPHRTRSRLSIDSNNFRTLDGGGVNHCGSLVNFALIAPRTTSQGSSMRIKWMSLCGGNQLGRYLSNNVNIKQWMLTKPCPLTLDLTFLLANIKGCCLGKQLSWFSAHNEIYIKLLKRWLWGFTVLIMALMY